MGYDNNQSDKYRSNRKYGYAHGILLGLVRFPTPRANPSQKIRVMAAQADCCYVRSTIAGRGCMEAGRRGRGVPPVEGHGQACAERSERDGRATAATPPAISTPRRRMEFQFSRTGQTRSFITHGRASLITPFSVTLKGVMASTRAEQRPHTEHAEQECKRAQRREARRRLCDPFDEMRISIGIDPIYTEFRP